MQNRTLLACLAMAIGPTVTFISGCAGAPQSSPQVPAAPQARGAAKPATGGYSIADLGALPGESTSEVGMSTQNRRGAINGSGQAAEHRRVRAPITPPSSATAARRI